MLAVAAAAFAAGGTPNVRAAAAPAAQPTAEPVVEDLSLAGRIDAVLATDALANASIGVSVVDLDDGEVLYQRNAETPLNPASNIKLVTTASALVILGPEHRYPTRLYRNDGALQGSVIKGDVYLAGSGDPSLVSEDLLAMAGELQALGITRITGGVVVDSSRFDRDELPPGFDQKDELASYRAPSGATSINFNTFVIRVRPGTAEGQPAIAGVDPDVRSIELTNEATTVAGHRRKLFADVEYGKQTKVRLWGEIGVDAGPGHYRYPVEQPARYAGEALAWALAQRGIRLGRSRIKMGEVPADARLLASHHSAPLSVLVRSVNKWSNNFMAEQILKTLADPTRPATFDGALDRVRTQLEAFGVLTEGARLGNGSGLYDTNRIKPRQLTSLLAAVYRDFRYRSDFIASLSVMGVDGTARSRIEDTTGARWARVKTGTLEGVSGLSGYVGAIKREPIAFSILFNDLPRGGTRQAREIQDQIVDLIARHAAGQPLVDPVPSDSQSASP